MLDPLLLNKISWCFNIGLQEGQRLLLIDQVITGTPYRGGGSGGDGYMSLTPLV